MYDKYYFEEYARLTLKFVFPYPQENFFCADKPQCSKEAEIREENRAVPLK